MPEPLTNKLTLEDVVLNREGTEEGTVEAVVARIDIRGTNSLVFEQDSIKQQDIVISGYGHAIWEGEWNPGRIETLPIGKGKIYEEGKVVKFKGNFFIEADHARQQYLIVKNMGKQQQWSIGVRLNDYEIKERKDKEEVIMVKDAEVIEVSPVLEGAQQRTRTVEINSLQVKNKKVQDEVEKLQAENENLTKENFRLEKELLTYKVNELCAGTGR